jgi:hypothetical protein
MDSNSNLTKSMTHHHQTNELTAWFLNLPLDESIGNKRHTVWSSNPGPHEARLEDQKAEKSSRRSSRRRENRQSQQMARKAAKSQNEQEPLKIKAKA